MRAFLKRLLTPPLVVFAAIVMVVEETLIDALQWLMARLARLRWIAALEARAARLPPYPAMLLFLLPGAVLLPVKLGALWAVAHGHVVLGGAVIVAGKIVGTAFSARIYKILRPTLVTLPWFARAEAWVFALRDRLYGYVRSLPAWQAAKRRVAEAKAWVRSMMPRSGWIARRFAALRRRRRRSA